MRILPLSAADFGYPPEGGAEFVHGQWSHLPKLETRRFDLVTAYHRRAVSCARIKHLVTSRSQERMHLF